MNSSAVAAKVLLQLDELTSRVGHALAEFARRDQANESL
jgi:hypothetical protein